MTEVPSPEAALARARQTLLAAEALLREGYVPDAVSRAYYAGLYAALALLASIGLSPKTHEGVRTLVNLHFVRTGKLQGGTGRLLTHLEGDREDADYDLAAVFSPEDGRGILDEATLFVQQAAQVLEKAPS